jgi:hypothetical protein
VASPRRYVYYNTFHCNSSNPSQTLRLFQQLVGDDSLKNVVLATTHWSQWDNKHSERQHELSEKHWQRMILHGSSIERHNGSRKSAIKIIEPLISSPPTVVKIVDELVEQKLSWEDTAVGRSMNEAFARIQRELKEELAAVKSYQRQTEERRAAEVKQGHNDRKELEEKYLKAAEEKDKKAIDTITELKEQMLAQREEQAKQWRQQLVEATKEKEEYMKMLEVKRQQRRSKRKFNGERFEEESSTPRWFPPPVPVRLYFRYPGYRIFDSTAWLAWALLRVHELLVWLVVTTSVFLGSPFVFSYYLMWVLGTAFQVTRIMFFSRDFFNSCGPNSHGLFFLLWELAQTQAICYNPYYFKEGVQDGAQAVLVSLVACVALRYIFNPCPSNF